MLLSRGMLAGAAVLVAAVAAWYLTRADVEGADVQRRLHAFAADVNQSTTDGRTPEARGLHLASYFTDDVEVDLGRGSAPIRGRETVVGIAERLQPRTAAFSLKFEDMTVALSPGGDLADVHLTAEFIRRSITTGEKWMDAREFTIALRRESGDWKIGRVTAVDTLK
jgi:hypothetical protein